jgi:hypothetical protein
MSPKPRKRPIAGTKELLDEAYERYATPAFIANDPTPRLWQYPKAGYLWYGSTDL